MNILYKLNIFCFSFDYRHIEGNKCQYSNVPDMYNLCPDAHSQEELDEWKERYEWRQMKREMARQEQVFSYMDQLLEKYEASQSSVKVVSDINTEYSAQDKSAS